MSDVDMQNVVSRIKEDWQLVTVAVVVCGIHGEKKFLISFEL